MSGRRVVPFPTHVAQAVCSAVASDLRASIALEEVVTAVLRLLRHVGGVGQFPTAHERALVRQQVMAWFESARAATPAATPEVAVLHPGPGVVQ